MLYPKEDATTKSLKYVCRRPNCGRSVTVDTQNSMDYCVAKTDSKISELFKFQNIEWKEMIDDPTLPRTKKVKCAKCGNKEAVLLTAITNPRSTTGLVITLVCTNKNCAHHWRDRAD